MENSVTNLSLNENEQSLAKSKEKESKLDENIMKDSSNENDKHNLIDEKIIHELNDETSDTKIEKIKDNTVKVS